MSELFLGVNVADVPHVAVLVGGKLVLTEVVAYLDLARMIGDNVLQNPRSAVIATYALCGFTHLASMAIFVGGISSLAPEKTREYPKSPCGRFLPRRWHVS